MRTTGRLLLLRATNKYQPVAYISSGSSLTNNAKQQFLPSSLLSLFSSGSGTGAARSMNTATAASPVSLYAT